MGWTSLRKAGTRLLLAYGERDTRRIIGYGARIRRAPVPELSFDLNPNLRVWNMLGRRYLDARDLAGGGIACLDFVEIADERILRILADFRTGGDGTPTEWTLTLELKGQHAFTVQPEWDESLVLHVVRSSEEDVAETA